MIRRTGGPADLLALRDRIELLVRPGVERLTPGTAEDQLHRETGSGSGRVHKDVITDVVRLRRATAMAVSGSAHPLLLSVNQEGGRLNALDWPEVEQLPGGLALGATASAETAELAGSVLGGQLRAVGLTWNLAPVCDLADRPSASAVGTRSFGSDPEQVSRLAAGFIRGLQSAGVAATAKHFPGLGGVRADPHHFASVVDRLAPGALEPFRAAVEAGVATVMVGSHTIREIDSRPALASRRVIGLLRDRLGFEGVTVSENLSIPAVHEPLGGPAAAAVAAVAAGVDVVMLDSEVSRGFQPQAARSAAVSRRQQVVRALLSAVVEGRLSRERVEQAADRVLLLQKRFGLAPGTVRPDWAQANAAARAGADRIAEESVAVLRGAHLLPLTTAPLAVLRVPDTRQRRADSAVHAPDLVPVALTAHGPRPIELSVGCDVPEGVRAVVVYSYDTRTDKDRPGAAATEAGRLSGRGTPVVHMSLGDLDELSGSPADVLLAAFSPHRASVSAAAATLLAHGRPRGVPPVGGQPW
ncbi:glycoside hydrolase family 3 N-terminal domain-containing protein [Streptomyces sp. NPDC055992]|uniref:glycoside hydrolase family 3 N-terminal domain-containing protein n=1 Tax=Streptomyces sp. NPDC055992 TaxID=3345673 RepID=UPI0035E23F62